MKRISDEKICDLECCSSGDGCCECGLSKEQIVEQRTRQKRNWEEFFKKELPPIDDPSWERE